MKAYKTESKRLLDLMINSIYTNKEIFLRELISNASDASDKLYFEQLQDGSSSQDRQSMPIQIALDEKSRTLSILDSGIGMNETDLENFLGTIAKSDSHAFKEALDDEKANPVDIIGQFGVGFYSAFMVSDKVEVISKKYKEDQAYRFVSRGMEGYQIEKSQRDFVGTTIVCHLKDNHDEENYDQYLDRFFLKQLVEKYSDYIPYPIQLKDEEGDWETVNSMVPLWRRSKNDVSQEDLNQFYKDQFYDFEDPMKTIQMKVEGMPSFDALLYIPARRPADFYTASYEPGLQLYSRGVYIMEHNKDLIPEYFGFVKGLVDSPDLSLNISREILQHDRQLQVISRRIERRIKNDLELMLKNDREKYEDFWNNFGMSIKYGAYVDFGAHKDKLENLILFNSSYKDELVSFKEYVERMKEDQEVIYYVSGESLAQCKMSPQAEYVRSKGFEVLYLIDELDEFVLQILNNYEGKNFQSVQQADLDLVDQTTKEKIEKQEEEQSDLLDALRSSLEGRVDDVKLSSRLVSHPVCLVSDDELSFEMEKVLNAMPDQAGDFKAKRILEINPDHELLKALERVHKNSPDSLEDYASVLYDQACLIEGLDIEDPLEFSEKISRLMVESSR